MMRFGIPGYRTPRDMLDAEIGRITSLDGVTVQHRRARRQGLSIDELDARLRRDLLGDRRAKGPAACPCPAPTR